LDQSIIRTYHSIKAARFFRLHKDYKLETTKIVKNNVPRSKYQFLNYKYVKIKMYSPIKFIK